MELKKCPHKVDHFPKPNAMKSFLNADVTSSLDGVDIAMAGVSDSHDTRLGTGEADAPAYLRRVDFWRVASSDEEMNIKVDEDLKIVDCGDIVSNSEEGDRSIADFCDEIRKKNVFPVFICDAEEKYLNPILDSIAEKKSISFIRFSAHPLDISKLTSCVVQSHSVEVGVRGTTDIAPDNRMQEILIDECFQENADKLSSKIEKIVGTNEVFLVFDADYLDPAYAPCTIDPAIGGVSVRDFMVVCDKLFPKIRAIGVGVFNVTKETDPGQNGLNDMITSLWKLVMCEAKELIIRKPEGDSSM
jgi:agmatinase